MPESMNTKTPLIITAAIAALIGALSGALAASLISGAAQSSLFLSQSLMGETVLSEREVDREIIELIEEETATIAVVERVTPAVVSVVIEVPRGNLLPNGFDPFSFSQELHDESSVNELIEIGGGTGFFVSSDGYIITNKHVVSDSSAKFTVITNDGAELPALLVASDAFFDIAILKVEGDAFPTVSFGDSDAIKIGQTVIAIGNTLSEFRNTVTKGVVSGINRRIVAGDGFGESDVIEGAIQTDAAINPGNSGGPLINLLGNVIGVNTAVSFEGESIGFAIPVNDVKKIVDDIRTHGRIIRPWLGVRYVILDEFIAEQEGLEYEQGALIVAGAYGQSEAVFAGSPADNAGLQEGDIILSIDGKEITSNATLAKIIQDYFPGDEIKLMIAREDEIFPVNVQLAELDSDIINQ
jgi:serine protease Do